MTERKNKQRLDELLAQKGWFDTKSQAQAALMSGQVKINEQVITKSGTLIKTDKDIKVEIKNLPYVSRGGFKLEKAVNEFSIEVKDKICLDIGASTGGFTDFLLQNGAAKVYAVDVGYGQLAWKLRQDSRVIVIERTNVKLVNAEDIYVDLTESADNYPAEFACVDVSFISVAKILENIKKLMNKDNQEIVLLIKPQFEAGRDQVPKSGVIRDKKTHEEVIRKVSDFSEKVGYFPVNLTFSPIKGPAGNIEYLIYLRNQNNCGKINNQTIKEVVKKAHENFDQSPVKK